MVRDVVTVTASVRDGVAPTLGTPVAANGSEFANSAGRTILVIVSGLGGAAVGAGARTVVPIQVADPYGRLVAQTPIAITNDTVMVLGPFPPLLYNQTDDTVDIDYVALSTNQSVFALQVTGV